MAFEVRSSPRHGTTFEVRVVPKASRCALVAEGDVLKVRVDAPPVEGEANDRLIRFLAKEVFGVARGSVRVIAGERGRNKTIAVDLDVETVRKAIEAAIAR